MNRAALLEAAILADQLADRAAARLLVAEADIGTAETPLSALAAAGDAVEHEAAARRWQAVAEKLRGQVGDGS